MMRKLQRIWDKNWPELHCALRGDLPDFVLRPVPRMPSNDVPVFCYHIPDAEKFENDLAHLRTNGYQTLTADQLLDHLNGTRPAPTGSVVLTFDDGPVELYTVAFPLLKKYELHAVAFIAPYFHDQVPEGMHDARACTWSELAEMDASGVVDVQSHTLEHRLLRRWPEPAPICGVVNGISIAAPTTANSFHDDFLLARTIIESRLRKTVRHLCFPCYDGTPEAIEVARAVGYEGFWWGVLPGAKGNRPAAGAACRISRLSDEFLRRLPGTGRVSLASVLTARYLHSARRWWRPVRLGLAST